MILTITLPEPTNNQPRTHVAAKVAADYVSFALSKLMSDSWPKLSQEGKLTGTVDAEFVGTVSWTLTADVIPAVADDEEALQEFTFEDVDITVAARTAKEAYATLCTALSVPSLGEFFTDTYSGPGVNSADTSDLWPDEDGETEQEPVAVETQLATAIRASMAQDRIRADYDPARCECGRLSDDCIANDGDDDTQHGDRP